MVVVMRVTGEYPEWHSEPDVFLALASDGLLTRGLVRYAIGVKVALDSTRTLRKIGNSKVLTLLLGLKATRSTGTSPRRFIAFT